jgi:leader peptidase (prepilin peptidase) / N-methyltransferase
MRARRRCVGLTGSDRRRDRAADPLDPDRVPAVSAATAVGCALLGAVLGPFLAALTRRVPAGEPPVRSGGWRGRPAGRRRRQTVTVLAALALGGVGAGVGWQPALPAYLLLAAIGLPLAVIDADCHRLPDRLTLPLYPAGIVLLAAASVARHDAGALARAVLAAATVFVAFLATALASPDSLGFGDVKLAGALGLFLGWLGWSVLLLGLVTGFVIGAGAALVLLAGRRAGWRSEVAFGPALLAGALLAVAAGQWLLDAYLPASGLPPAS